MRVLKLEIKKVMKTRRTWVLIAASLFLSVIMAYFPVTFQYAERYDEAGEKTELQGMEAIRYLKEVRADITGEVTPDKVRKAVEDYQACLQEYGVAESWDLPDGIYGRRIVPFAPLLRGVKEAFANRDTGMAPSVMDIAPSDVDDYYTACKERLISLMKMEEKENPDIGEVALHMYLDVKTPYLYYPGYTSDALEYEGFLAMFLLLFGMIMAAPVFSSDYQTGADDILRCTKHGHIRLGAAKIVSTVIISAVLFIVCMVIHLLAVNAFFGWECLKTSLQMEFSITNLADWNIGQMQRRVALTGLLTVVATVCFTLFLSTKCRNVITSLSAGFFICLAPLFLSQMFGSSSKAAVWLRCLLPSCGVCPPVSFLYEAIDYHFLKLGNLILWVPYAMAVFAGIETVVFVVLALRSYTAHQ